MHAAAEQLKAQLKAEAVRDLQVMLPEHSRHRTTPQRSASACWVATLQNQGKQHGC
jgi:hypothetical protein